VTVKWKSYLGHRFSGRNCDCPLFDYRGLILPRINLKLENSSLAPFGARLRWSFLCPSLSVKKYSLRIPASHFYRCI